MKCFISIARAKRAWIILKCLGWNIHVLHIACYHLVWAAGVAAFPAPVLGSRRGAVHAADANEGGAGGQLVAAVVRVDDSDIIQRFVTSQGTATGIAGLGAKCHAAVLAVDASNFDHFLAVCKLVIAYVHPVKADNKATDGNKRAHCKIMCYGLWGVLDNPWNPVL